MLFVMAFGPRIVTLSRLQAPRDVADRVFAPCVAPAISRARDAALGQEGLP
jgi:hypothetical protein